VEWTLHEVGVQLHSAMIALWFPEQKSMQDPIHRIHLVEGDCRGWQPSVRLTEAEGLEASQSNVM
jgi:hypothetical protein